MDTLEWQFRCVHRITVFILVLLALIKMESAAVILYVVLLGLNTTRHVPISVIVPLNKMENTAVIIYNLLGVNTTRSASLLIAPAS